MQTILQGGFFRTKFREDGWRNPELKECPQDV
jgi:hypothetical protein